MKKELTCLQVTEMHQERIDMLASHRNASRKNLHACKSQKIIIIISSSRSILIPVYV
jgi:hypothetical protein